MRRSKGFTLIEILVAMAIFSLLAVSAYSVLVNVMQQDKLIQERGDRLTDLQRAMLIMERDFLQLTPRKMRFEAGEPSPQYIGAAKNLFDSESFGIGFARSGWQNPQMILPRSRIQPLAYRIFEGDLERLHYNFPDPVVGSEPKVRKLFKGVEELNVEFFKDGKWVPNWQGSGTPPGIAITLKTKSFGEIRRVFLTSEIPEKEQRVSAND